jgi:hypothetical protein
VEQRIRSCTTPGGAQLAYATAGQGFVFADRGERSLRGFEAPLRLHEVRWREES